MPCSQLKLTSWPYFHHFCFSQIPSIAISLVYNNITPFLFSVLPKNKKRSCSSFLAPLQPCDYHATVAKIYVGAQFISVCLLVVIKGLSAKQKSFPQQRFFFFLMLTARLTVDFILQAQLLTPNCVKLQINSRFDCLGTAVSVPSSSRRTSVF